MMMKRCACLAVFVCITFNLLLCAKEVEGVHWKYCKGEWEAKISNATVVPDPARAGQEINVLIQGEIGKFEGKALVLSTHLLSRCYPF